MADIESKNIDIGAWWWASEVTDYSKILWNKQEEIGDKDTAEEKKKADEELIAKIEWTENKKDTPVINHETNHTKTQRKDGEQRKQNNPWQYNENRFSAGNSLINDIQKPDANIVAKWAQRILKKLNIFW